ncbi:TPA: lysozyme inhibitor LprI family protein [Klebsiella pneumoniae]
MKRTLFAVMALLASGAALADECSSANTQTEMNNQCAAAQYQAADKKLNDTWQQALQRAVGKQQTLLKQAQQAWIALRDADCAFLASGAEGGSMQPMLVSQCMTDKSVERESFLASLLQCEDGDQSCPLPPAN